MLQKISELLGDLRYTCTVKHVEKVFTSICFYTLWCIICWKKVFINVSDGAWTYTLVFLNKHCYIHLCQIYTLYTLSLFSHFLRFYVICFNHLNIMHDKDIFCGHIQVGLVNLMKGISELLDVFNIYMLILTCSNNTHKCLFLNTFGVVFVFGVY